MQNYIVMTTNRTGDTFRLAAQMGDGPRAVRHLARYVEKQYRGLTVRAVYLIHGEHTLEELRDMELPESGTAAECFLFD